MGRCYTVVGLCTTERNPEDQLQLSFELLEEDGFRTLQLDNDYMNGKFWAESITKTPPQ